MVPPDATTKGLCLSPMVAEARRRGIALKGARERYLPFLDYPLVEHMRLLVETAHLFYPNLCTRQGLRKLGRAAHSAIAETLIGKIVWGGVDGVHGALDSAVRCYAITVPCTRVSVVERSAGSARVRLGSECPSFLDSHHVGVFEAVIRDVQGFERGGGPATRLAVRRRVLDLVGAVAVNGVPRARRAVRL